MADRRVHITFSGHVPVEQQPAQSDTEWPVEEKQEDTAGCITPPSFCPPLFTVFPSNNELLSPCQQYVDDSLL